MNKPTPYPNFKIKNHHGLVYLTRYCAEEESGTRQRYLYIASAIFEFMNYETENCTVYLDTIVNKIIDTGLDEYVCLPPKLDSCKRLISRAIKWMTKEFPCFTRKLNSKSDDFGNYEGRGASTYSICFASIEVLLKNKLYAIREANKQKKLELNRVEMLKARRMRLKAEQRKLTQSKLDKRDIVSSSSASSSYIKNNSNNNKYITELETEKTNLDTSSSVSIPTERALVASRDCEIVGLRKLLKKFVRGRKKQSKAKNEYARLEEEHAKRKARQRAHTAALERYKSSELDEDFNAYLRDLGEREELLRDEMYLHTRRIYKADLFGAMQSQEILSFAKALSLTRGYSSHNTLFLGPPGTGKTMLASRLCDLLPEMSDEEAMETASVASLTQSEINEHNWKTRPFRAPHHSSSMAALVGGGSVPRPGEISLAHNGLLFLDEMPVILITKNYQIHIKLLNMIRLNVF